MSIHPPFISKNGPWVPKEASFKAGALRFVDRVAAPFSDRISKAELPEGLLSTPKPEVESTIAPGKASSSDFGNLKRVYSPVAEQADGTFHGEGGEYANINKDLTDSYLAAPDDAARQQILAGYQGPGTARYDKDIKQVLVTHRPPVFGPRQAAILNTDPRKYQNRQTYENALRKSFQETYRKMPYWDQLRGGGAFFDDTQRMANEARAYADALLAAGRKKEAYPWIARAATLNAFVEKARPEVDQRLRQSRARILFGGGLGIAAAGLTYAALRGLFGASGSNVTVNNAPRQASPWTVRGFQGRGVGEI